MDKKNIAIVIGVVLLGVLLSELWLSNQSSEPKKEISQTTNASQKNTDQESKSKKKKESQKAKKTIEKSGPKGAENLQQNPNLPEGFALSKWKRKDSVDVKAEFGDFSELTHRNDCLRVMPFKHPISQGNLPENVLSPLILLENGQPLTIQNISKEECTASVTYRDYQLLLNPSTSGVNDSAFSFALSADMPLKTEHGNIYWLYKDTIQVVQLNTTKIGSTKTLELRLQAHYIGAKTRDPVAIIGGERHVFNSTTENQMEILTSIPNENAQVRLRLRTFNFMILDAVDVKVDGKWVPLLY